MLVKFLNCKRVQNIPGRAPEVFSDAGFQNSSLYVEDSHVLERRPFETKLDVLKEDLWLSVIRTEDRSSAIVVVDKTVLSSPLTAEPNILVV